MVFDLSTAKPVTQSQKPASSKPVGFDADTAKPVGPKAPNKTMSDDQFFAELDARMEEKRNNSDQSTWQSVKDFFSGSDRETRATKELPELQNSGVLAGLDIDPVTMGQLSMNALLTTDPKEIADIFRSVSSEIGVQEDEKGNILIANNKTGAKAVVNKPGVSALDILQGLGLAAAFTPAAKAGALALTTPGKMVAVGTGAAATQAGIEGMQASQGGEFDVENVAIAGGGGFVFEGVFQKLADKIPAMRQAIKQNAGKVTEKIRKQFKQKAVEVGENPDDLTDDVILSLVNKEPTAGEKEFGVQLTKGQRSGKQSDLRLEDDFVSGRKGADAQEIMIDHRNTVAQQARNAATKIQDDIGRGNTITSQQEAGAVVKQGVINAEREMDDLVAQARDKVGEAKLNPDAFKKLIKTTKQSIRGIEYPTDKKIAPATNALLTEIRKAERMFNQKGMQIKSQHIQRIEQIRRSIGAYIDSAANTTDKRNMVAMKRAYDDYLDDAVTKALFEGDQNALNALKSSRALFSEYAKRFRANPTKTKSGRTLSDKPGNFVEEIIEGNPTDMQVVNSIFGAGNTFGNQTGKQMAQKYKSILGGDSVEWDAIRQAGFKRLIKTYPDGKTINGKQTLKNINMVNDKNPELLQAIFSKEEISLFKRFARHVERTQPEIIKGSANPSGTGLIVDKALKSSVAKVINTLGMTSGDPALLAAGQVMQSSKRQAKNVIRPFEKIINPKPTFVGAGTAATEKTVERARS